MDYKYLRKVLLEIVCLAGNFLARMKGLIANAFAKLSRISCQENLLKGSHVRVPSDACSLY